MGGYVTDCSGDDGLWYTVCKHACVCLCVCCMFQGLDLSISHIPAEAASLDSLP